MKLLILSWMHECGYKIRSTLKRTWALALEFMAYELYLIMASSKAVYKDNTIVYC